MEFGHYVNARLTLSYKGIIFNLLLIAGDQGMLCYSLKTIVSFVFNPFIALKRILQETKYSMEFGHCVNAPPNSQL